MILQRIFRSATAGGALAFAKGFDIAYAIRKDMQQAIRVEILIIMLADSEILFKVLTRSRTRS